MDGLRQLSAAVGIAVAEAAAEGLARVELHDPGPAGARRDARPEYPRVEAI
ncbi:hypothetical protein [Geodermatophilus obscurus]|uniref:hypothetical protein n=1 Tax=Geodermatophilus obscurus TaxID=1861 RepID=UPI00019B75EB|nr:hypothetical protein [Geodermatophilus obscurus]